MKVLTEPTLWNEEQIKLIEEKYKAKYVMEACLGDGKGNWCNWPAAIFYTKVPHPKGSHYFAFYHHPISSLLTIANGHSAIAEPIEGIMIDETVIYSRYRHDYRSYGDVFIDGGRDYVRVGGNDMFRAKPVTLHVVEDRIEVHLEE